MTIQEARKYIIEKLKLVYEESEASNISDLLIESITGTKKTDRAINKDKALTNEQSIQLNKFLARLSIHEPIQYVLNEAWFYKMKFYVDPDVLIPRSETEELVDWVISDCKFPINELKVLDIGTGSGCIPIILKRKFRKADVWSIDISEAALSVAKKNAETLGAKINFLHFDFLNTKEWEKLASYDVIVSNPPYVPEKDKTEMRLNVINYEPSTALFVPDNDVMIFYKAIADLGKTNLNKNGNIYVEIHENLAEDVCKLFQSNDYSTELKKDMQGKDRMIKATHSL